MTVLLDTNVILDGENIQADYIITRDSKGYIDSAIATATPTDFLTILEQDAQNE